MILLTVRPQGTGSPDVVLYFSAESLLVIPFGRPSNRPQRCNNILNTVSDTELPTLNLYTPTSFGYFIRVRLRRSRWPALSGHLGISVIFDLWGQRRGPRLHDSGDRAAPGPPLEAPQDPAPLQANLPGPLRIGGRARSTVICYLGNCRISPNITQGSRLHNPSIGATVDDHDGDGEDTGQADPYGTSRYPDLVHYQTIDHLMSRRLLLTSSWPNPTIIRIPRLARTPKT